MVFSFGGSGMGLRLRFPGMKVLLVSPDLPVPFGSTYGRWVYAISSELVRQGHSVTCIACTSEGVEAQEEAKLVASNADLVLHHVPLQLREMILVRKARSLIRPFSEYARVPELKAILSRESSAGIDVMHVDQLFLAWLSLGEPRAVVFVDHLDTIDWEHRRKLTFRDRLTKRQMKRATHYLLRHVERAIVASPRLARVVKSINPRLEPRIVPLCIDLSLYPELAVQQDLVVGIIGSMHWYPSQSAAERVLTRLWPQIHRRVPAARLVVAGWNAERYLGEHFPLPGAELMVRTDHPLDFFSRVAMLLYPPARGSGMKVKVLEAMAYGIPVISNEEGLEGMAYVDGIHCVRAETDQEFIRETVALLHDPERRRRIGHAGRGLVQSHHTPGVVAERLIEAYRVTIRGADL